MKLIIYATTDETVATIISEQLKYDIIRAVKLPAAAVTTLPVE